MWFGWRRGIVPRLQPLGPRFKSRQEYYADRVFPTWLCWLSLRTIICGFPPRSKTETFFLIFSPLGSWQVQCFAQGTIPLQALLLYGSPTVSRMSMLIIHSINLIKQLFIS